MELRVIFDGTVQAASKNLTQRFQGGQFLYFDPQLPPDQALEIGVSLLVELPGLNGNLLKLWEDLGTLDTDRLIPIPKEVNEAPYDFYLAFGTSVNHPNFRAYVVYSNVTQESLSQQIADLQTEIQTLLENQTTLFNLTAAIGGNQILQNTALSILGTGLIPITAGVTSVIPPLLAAPLLLPP